MIIYIVLINNTGINRTLADKIFRHIMQETGVDNRTVRRFYIAVRCFGVNILET